MADELQQLFLPVTCKEPFVDKLAATHVNSCNTYIAQAFISFPALWIPHGWHHQSSWSGFHLTTSTEQSLHSEYSIDTTYLKYLDKGY